MRWSGVVTWVVGGLALLAFYRRHPQAARRGLAAVAVQLCLCVPLDWWWRSHWTDILSRKWAFDHMIAFQWVAGGLRTLAYLLLVWAAVTDRASPPDDE